MNTYAKTYARQMAKLSIIPDTNTLLHYLRPDQIDWGALAQEDDVDIVFVSVVLSEIDKHKNQHPISRVRDRARDVSEWLRRIRREPKVAGARPIEFFLEEPKTLPKHLDASVNDDRLVASALAYRALGREVAVFTDDTLLGFKLDRDGLRELNPTPDLRLKETPDPVAAENQKLRTELAQLKSRLPALRLELLGEADVLDLRIPTARTEGIPSLDKIRRDFPRLATPTKPAGPGFEGLALTGFTGRRAADVEAYNEKLVAFYAEYEEFFGKWQQVMEWRRRIVPMRFTLTNTGTATATHVSVVLNFVRPQLQVLEQAPSLPEPPRPPPEPTFLGITSPVHLQIPFGVRPRAWNEMITPDPSLFELEIDTRTNRVELSTQRLQHGSKYTFAPLLVAVGSTVLGSAASIDVEVLADELPKATTQRMILKVSEDPSAPMPSLDR